MSHTGPMCVELLHMIVNHANGVARVNGFEYEDRKARELAAFCQWAKDNRKACVREYGFAYPELVEALRKLVAKRAAAKESKLTQAQRMAGRGELVDYCVKRKDWFDKYQKGNIQSARYR